jgi:hypothetical protein
MLLCAEGKLEGKLGDAGEMKLELCVPRSWDGQEAMRALRQAGVSYYF